MTVYAAVEVGKQYPDSVDQPLAVSIACVAGKSEHVPLLALTLFITVEPDCQVALKTTMLPFVTFAGSFASHVSPQVELPGLMN